MPTVAGDLRNSAFAQLDPDVLERLLEGEENRLLLLRREKNMRGVNPPAGCRSFHDVYCNYSLITACAAGSRNIKAALYTHLASKLLPVMFLPLGLPQSCSCSPKEEPMDLKVQKIEPGDTWAKVEAVTGWFGGVAGRTFSHCFPSRPLFNNSFLYPASE